MINFKSIKTQLIIFLIILAIFIGFKDNDPRFLLNCLVSAFFALILEAIINYFKKRTFKLTESASITGLIIGYILSSDTGIFRFFIANILAIISKYLIHFQKRHIFNPAAFGIFISTLLFNTFTEWRGTYLWYILIPFGIYFAYKIKKIEIIFGYMISSLLLFGLQAIMRGYSLKNILGYFSYFYIFIMIIEPKTTPISYFGKYIFGIVLAILIFILMEIGLKFDLELLSLLVMNGSVPLLNKIRR